MGVDLFGASDRSIDQFGARNVSRGDAFSEFHGVARSQRVVAERVDAGTGAAGCGEVVGVHDWRPTGS